MNTQGKAVTLSKKDASSLKSKQRDNGNMKTKMDRIYLGDPARLEALDIRAGSEPQPRETCDTPANCPDCGIELTQIEPGLAYCPDCKQDLPKIERTWADERAESYIDPKPSP